MSSEKCEAMLQTVHQSLVHANKLITEKFGLLDYQDDSNTPSQMNLWGFKIHLNLESAKFEFDSVNLVPEI